MTKTPISDKQTRLIRLVLSGKKIREKIGFVVLELVVEFGEQDKLPT